MSFWKPKGAQVVYDFEQSLTKVVIGFNYGAQKSVHIL